MYMYVCMYILYSYENTREIPIGVLPNGEILIIIGLAEGGKWRFMKLHLLQCYMVSY